MIDDRKMKLLKVLGITFEILGAGCGVARNCISSKVERELIEEKIEPVIKDKLDELAENTITQVYEETKKRLCGD